MNPGFSSQEIEKIKAACAKAKRSYVLQEEDTFEDGFAQFFFVGTHEGKPVVFDAFLYLLEMEYFENLINDAIAATKETYPKFKNADFEELTGEHIEIMEQVAEELAKDEQYDVCEFIDIDTETEFGVAIDVCLNVPEVTHEVIEKFVKDFTSNKLKLDPTFYSFSVDFDD